MRARRKRKSILISVPIVDDEFVVLFLISVNKFEFPRKGMQLQMDEVVGVQILHIHKLYFF